MAESANDAIFGINIGEHSYPSTDNIVFGSDFANRDFVTPMAKFTFYDAKGQPLSGTNAPHIYIRMGGSFNTSLINGYSEAQGIFGSPNGTGIAGLFGADPNNPTSLSATLGRLGDSAITGIQKQIIAAIAGATGYATSAGQSGKAQVEFLQRKMLNSFQQLIYAGPSFRRFQLPFNMRPTDAQEAENMLSIISSFRVASSPRSGAGTLSEFLEGARGTFSNTALEESTPDISREDYDSDKEYNDALLKWAELKAEYWLESDVDELVSTSSSVFSFGYPDMCKLELVLKKGDELATLFRSDFCMIESVTVDYGAQNKMTFFDGDTNTQLFPTDVNLTISLREATLVTASKATSEYLSGTVIL